MSLLGFAASGNYCNFVALACYKTRCQSQHRRATVTQQKTWGGRFSGDTDSRVEAFTESISFDKRLYPYDIVGSQAHARMLGEVGLLTAQEAEQIVAVLDQIQLEIHRGQFAFSTKLEDIHTHIEQALIQRLGDVGRKLHTGRSRNDQVVTDVKLWTRDAIDQLQGRLLDLQTALLHAALQNKDLILPGYTHMQRAQPVLAAHYFLAYIEKYQRDRERLADCRKRVNVLPLGAAALAGTSLPIDRESVRRQLGFDAVAANSLDVSSDRDFVLEFVFDLSLIAVHLAGWAEEWVLWATTEFGFLDLPDAFCTGSSIMPHKKNPDVLELIRGKSARVAGDLQQLLVLVKGLPLAYNRDLQEDKVPLFDAFDTVSASLELAAALVRETKFRREAIEARLEAGHLDATTLMEFLVAQGLPMRSAHEAVGKLVRLCEERRCRLADLPAEVYEAIRPGLGQGVYKVLGVKNALQAFRSAGSTAPAEVEKQIEAWRHKLT
jgi:argininosuccinate lyase